MIDLSLLDDVLKEYGKSPENTLIRVLQKTQDIYGYLPKEAIYRISLSTKIPCAKIYGVATFYGQFRLKPHGKHVIRVCDGTACHVKNSEGLIDEIKSILGISPGETTEDNLFTLETVACLGACGLAPIMTVDDEVYGRLTPDKIAGILEMYK